jgi:hypothetical protein
VLLAKNGLKIKKIWRGSEPEPCVECEWVVVAFSVYISKPLSNNWTCIILDTVKLLYQNSFASWGVKREVEVSWGSYPKVPWPCVKFYEIDHVSYIVRLQFSLSTS